jgi:voltage-gated potassium channel
MTAAERLANHKGLIWLFVAWIGVMFLTAFGLYVSEVGVNEAVQSPLDALWWGLTTMTTVGYGDVYPTTPEGRLSAAVLMILGIGLYSAITATLTSFLIAGDERPLT